MFRIGGKMTSISIIIPVYNEESTISEILKRVDKVELPWKKNLIIIDDGSSDKTDTLVKKFLKLHPEAKYIRHPNNLGKGAAVITGIQNSHDDYVIIQDADLEYDPTDIARLISAHTGHPKEVIYGSRLTKPPIIIGKNRTPLLLHYFGNKLLSLIASLLYDSWVTDMETGYKLFPRKSMDNIKLTARGFELEPEITSKFLKNGYRIKEIPITTKPRSYDQGKKLRTWDDGIKALRTLIKYRFVD
jgi:glycosyltransferase involved in cell wall biosynthesis